jgi:hypothetical protein
MYGEIYEETWWGVEVTPSGWGNVYDYESSQELWSFQASNWTNELNTYKELK